MNTVLFETELANGVLVQLVQGDITQERVAAIVNAANEALQHGGGVAGAIVRRGGRSIQVESDAWVRAHGLVTHAEPAYTRAGNLPCRYIIHAVGPVWGEGDEDARLNAAIRGALWRADQLSLESIAFPAISTGIFGFPKERAARVMLEALQEYLKVHPASGIQRVRLTLFDQATITAFTAVWQAFGWGGEQFTPD